MLSPAQVKDDLESIRRELQQTLSDQVAAAHSLHSDGPRWAGDQPARSGIFRLRLRRCQGLRRCPRCARSPPRLSARPTTCASKATPTICPFTPRTSIPTGSFLRPAPPALPGSFSTLKRHPARPAFGRGLCRISSRRQQRHPEGRAQNRRVDLVVLPRTKINFAAPDSARRWPMEKNYG